MISSEGLGPRKDYRLVEIRVLPSTDNGVTYPVELEVEGFRTFPIAKLQLDHGRLLALAADPRSYGRALGEMLLAPGALGDAYRETVAVVQARGEAMRVRLRLDPAELYTLGWERVYVPLDGEWQPLAVVAITPFSRYVPEDWESPSPPWERPLRMLAVIASPAGLPGFGLDLIPAGERQTLRALLDGLPNVTVTYLESDTATPPTLNRLRTALADGYHLVHFLCHGAAEAAGTVLYLEDDAGGVVPVRADRLVDAFSAVKTPPRLVFLAACETAARGRYDAFVPLGPTLVARRGLQAVIAMSDRVGIDTARMFTGQFYARLLAHGLADLAMNEARALVQDQWDWGAPILFSRLPDNQLIDFLVGGFYANYLSHTDRAFSMADAALAVAQGKDNGQQVVANLESLIKELSKSHKVLVEYASDFREVDNNPATFAARFKDFYYKFKKHYDSEDWVKEDTSCHKIMAIGQQLLPAVRPFLDKATFDELDKELRFLGDADLNLLELFHEFLEAMNAAVEEIRARVVADDIPGAIARKQDFEAQISPSFRRSKEMLAKMTSSLGHVQAA